MSLSLAIGNGAELRKAAHVEDVDGVLFQIRQGADPSGRELALGDEQRQPLALAPDPGQIRHLEADS